MSFPTSRHTIRWPLQPPATGWLEDRAYRIALAGECWAANILEQFRGCLAIQSSSWFWFPSLRVLVATFLTLPQLQIERQQRAQNFIVHSLRRETWAQAPIRVGKASTALPTEQTPLPLSTNGYRMRSNHWIEERDRKIFLQVPAASKIKKGN